MVTQTPDKKWGTYAKEWLDKQYRPIEILHFVVGVCYLEIASGLSFSERFLRERNGSPRVD